MSDTIYSYLERNGSINLRSLRSAYNFVRAAIKQRKLGCASIDDLRAGLALGARLSRIEMAAHMSLLLESCFAPSLDVQEKLAVRFRPGINSEETFITAAIECLKTHKIAGGSDFPSTVRFIRDCRLYVPTVMKRGPPDDHYSKGFGRGPPTKSEAMITPRPSRFIPRNEKSPQNSHENSPSTITESTYSTERRDSIVSEYGELDLTDGSELKDVRERARCDGIDFLYPQDVHDKVLAGIFAAVRELPTSGLIGNQLLIDTVTKLKTSGYVSQMKDLSTASISALISLLKNCSVLLLKQESPEIDGAIAWALNENIASFEELRVKHDFYVISYLRQIPVEVSSNVMGQIIWNFNNKETLTRLRAIRYFMADCRRLFYPNAPELSPEEMMASESHVSMGIAEKVTFGETVVVFPAADDEEPAVLPPAEEEENVDATSAAAAVVRQRPDALKLGYADGHSSTKPTQMKSLTVCVDHTDDHFSPRGGGAVPGITPKIFYSEGDDLSPFPTCASTATVDLYKHLRTSGDSPSRPLRIEAVDECSEYPPKKRFSEDSAESPGGSPSSYSSSEELLAKAMHPSPYLGSSSPPSPDSLHAPGGGSRLDWSNYLPTSYGQLFQGVNTPPRAFKSRDFGVGIAQRVSRPLVSISSPTAGGTTLTVRPSHIGGTMQVFEEPNSGQADASAIPRPTTTMRSLFGEAQEGGQPQRGRGPNWADAPPYVPRNYPPATFTQQQHHEMDGHPASQFVRATYSTIARGFGYPQMGSPEPSHHPSAGSMTSIPTPFAYPAHQPQHHYLPPAGTSTPNLLHQRWSQQLHWGLQKQAAEGHQGFPPGFEDTRTSDHSHQAGQPSAH